MRLERAMLTYCELRGRARHQCAVTPQSGSSTCPKHKAPTLDRTIVLDGHRVEVTEVFWAYWYLAAERQAIFMRRLHAEPGPWTADTILLTHRFTNAYRASDRVSQYLLQRVIYSGSFDGPDTVFRILLFKIFNRIETWEHLVSQVGQPTVDSFSPEWFSEVLSLRFNDGDRLYSGAYIMPSPQLGLSRKHENHVWLLEELIRSGVVEDLLQARSLQELFERLLAIPSFGPFLAFQYAIDLNYGPHFEFDEMEFVVPGPGALRGIAKCFTDVGDLSPTDVIRAMTNAAPTYFDAAGTVFADLWGRRLQLIDCQNLFCEVDKYARVRFPHVGHGGPTRIKQTFTADPTPISLGYPPKWGLPWTADAPTVFGDATIDHPNQPLIDTSREERGASRSDSWRWNRGWRTDMSVAG